MKAPPPLSQTSEIASYTIHHNVDQRPEAPCSHPLRFRVSTLCEQRRWLWWHLALSCVLDAALDDCLAAAAGSIAPWLFSRLGKAEALCSHALRLPSSMGARTQGYSLARIASTGAAHSNVLRLRVLWSMFFVCCVPLLTSVCLVILVLAFIVCYCR